MVLLSAMSEPGVLWNLTVSRATLDHSGFARETFLLNSSDPRAEPLALQLRQAPVLRLMPRYELSRAHTLQLGGHAWIEAAVMEPSGQHATFVQLKCQGDGPGALISVHVPENASGLVVPPLSLLGTTPLPAGVWPSSASAIGVGAGMLLGTMSTPPQLLRSANASDGAPEALGLSLAAAAATGDGDAVTAAQLQGGSVSFVLASGGFVYVGLNAWPAVVLKVRVEAGKPRRQPGAGGAPTLKVQAALRLAADELLPSAAVMDEQAGVLFVGCLGSAPARVVMLHVTPSGLRRYDSLSLDAPGTPHEGALSLLLDPARQLLYVGLNSQPAVLVRLRLQELHHSDRLPAGWARSAQALLRSLATRPFNVSWRSSWHPWERPLDKKASPTSSPSEDGHGHVHDGGQNMYNNGNVLSTSAPGCAGAGSSLPYGDDFKPLTSVCFGGEADEAGPPNYRMKLLDGMMVLLARNDLASGASFSFRVRGGLGASARQGYVAFNFSFSADAAAAATWRGHVKSVCRPINATSAAGATMPLPPSVHHLTVVLDDAEQPAPSHSWGASASSDEDNTHGVRAGSPLLYLVYADGSGECWAAARHRQLFEHAVRGLMPGLRHGGYGTPTQHRLVLAAEKGYASGLVLDAEAQHAYAIVNVHRSFGVQRIALQPMAEAGFARFGTSEQRPRGLLRSPAGSLLVAFHSNPAGQAQGQGEGGAAPRKLSALHSGAYDQRGGARAWADGGGSAAQQRAAISRLRDGAMRLPVLSLLSSSTREGGGAHSVAVVLSGVNRLGVSLAWELRNGSAKLGEDVVCPLAGTQGNGTGSGSCRGELQWARGEVGVRSVGLRIVDDLRAAGLHLTSPHLAY